ncbi:4-hydroxyphenylpyruvate dioxygenase [Albidovulum inexpectatum]|uniref:3-dehydroshikimate dehydratase n=1 Tax=Albidovulum inexpectatum TaxID=196587 RepID=A0A2S5JHY0_9RHOB|nr:sugar phosphate isomerase/epimerase and 4-hydroxyphenylpyruvate domain-containing protein [Albidovulum inexpectatum]PPB80895.1 4-hydroxyphenylpyruvate dioxygenase [Albidovulum inexpectatum]
MRLSISTLSAPDLLESKLAAFAAAGFEGVEISEEDMAVQGVTPAELGRMVRDRGLSVTLFHAAVDLEGLPEPARGRAFDRLERRMDVMQELGAELLLIGAAGASEAQGGIDRMAADLAALAERAASRGLRVGFEPRVQARHVADYRDGWEIVRRADHPALGLVLDSFHVLARGTPVDPIRSIPAERIFHVQLADAPAVAMDLSFKARHFRLMPGEGELDLVGFVRAVAATGYAGTWGLDLRHDRSRPGSRALAAEGRRAMIALADAARRAEPGLDPGLRDFPAPAPLHGVEFVEFAAGGEDAAALGQMLTQLGFARRARHMRREVDLWRQDGINIVVNSERSGYAHSAWVLHGASVCDLGLWVGDAEAAAERAEALGVRRFVQPRHEDELQIPAVRGVGGSVLHLLDRGATLGAVWDREFRPVGAEEGAAASPVGLTGIDHLAQVCRAEELPGWVQFHATIFDLAKVADTGVADPGGLVRSVALQSPDGSFRLTMNGVDTHRTFAGRFLSESYGAPVQHVAFACADLFATARALDRNGFASLPIPAPYYQDLAADFGLSSDFVDALRRWNILYDRDPRGGEFLQLYSRPHGDGFFFEIVERRGGYDGYGARNAPWRTAALRRVRSG